jgi:hypothetical protein
VNRPLALTANAVSVGSELPLNIGNELPFGRPRHSRWLSQAQQNANAQRRENSSTVRTASSAAPGVATFEVAVGVISGIGFRHAKYAAGFNMSLQRSTGCSGKATVMPLMLQNVDYFAFFRKYILPSGFTVRDCILKATTRPNMCHHL